MFERWLALGIIECWLQCEAEEEEEEEEEGKTICSSRFMLERG